MPGFVETGVAKRIQDLVLGSAVSFPCCSVNALRDARILFTRQGFDLNFSHAAFILACRQPLADGGQSHASHFFISSISLGLAANGYRLPALRLLSWYQRVARPSGQPRCADGSGARHRRLVHFAPSGTQARQCHCCGARPWAWPRGKRRLAAPKIGGEGRDKRESVPKQRLGGSRSVNSFGHRTWQERRKAVATGPEGRVGFLLPGWPVKAALQSFAPRWVS